MQHVVDCGRQSCACRLVSFFVFVACLFAIARRKTCFFKVGFIANEGVLSVPDALL